jgi:hypothetical protein
LGKILDLRNKDTCPNLRNVAKYSSAKIKDLCITAYQKQMEQLAEHEGKEGSLFTQLKNELADVLFSLLIYEYFLFLSCFQVKKVDVDKADKEAKKFYQ